MKTPKYFDKNIPLSFKHQVQADLAHYEIENLREQIKNKPPREE